MICLSYYLLCFLFNKIREMGGTGSAWKQGVCGGAVAETVYTHVNKCTKDKRKAEKN
jgi:hypothetical protein